MGREFPCPRLSPEVLDLNIPFIVARTLRIDIVPYTRLLVPVVDFPVS